MAFFRDSHIDFMKYRKVLVPISLVLMAVGISLVFLGHVNVGIDFVGGTQLTLVFDEEPEVDRLRSVLGEAGMPDALIQRFGDPGSNEVLVKTATIDGTEEGSREQVVEALDASYNQGVSPELDLNRVGSNVLAAALFEADPDGVAPSQVDEGQAHYDGVAEAIIDLRRDGGMIHSWDELSSIAGVSAETASWVTNNASLGNYSIVGVENVGPQIGQELRRKGLLAVLLSMFGMMAYIWIRFELRFGVGAVVAVMHDVGITLGLFALGGFEFNLTTVAAFLTVVGYSVNDSVVVFDRVRENMAIHRRMPVTEMMNLSLNQTLSRTLLTSSTTLLAVGSLFFLGGDVIRGFAFVVMVGVAIGTYSSIFIACPFAILWEQWFGAEAKARKASASRNAPRKAKARKA